MKVNQAMNIGITKAIFTFHVGLLYVSKILDYNVISVFKTPWPKSPKRLLKKYWI
jgi:hypothetical protein